MRIRSLAFSPDGKWLASGASAFGRPGEVRVWDLEKGELAAYVTLPGELDSIKTLSPASLVVAGQGLLAEVHPFRGARRALENFREVFALAPDGVRRAWADGVDIVLGDERVIETAHLSEIRSLDWHPRNPMLASGGDDSMANVWDAGSGEKLREIPWNGDSVRCVRFAADGSLGIAGDGGRVLLVGPDGESEEFKVTDSKPMEAVAISAEGRVAAGGQSGKIYLFDRATRACVAVLSGHAGHVRALCFAAGGLVSAGEDGTLRLWDGQSGRELHVTARGKVLRRLFFHPEVPAVIAAGLDERALAFDTLGRRMATFPAGARVTGGVILPESDRVWLVDALGNEYKIRLGSLLAKGSA
jgi:WD40 repeat protein